MSNKSKWNDDYCTFVLVSVASEKLKIDNRHGGAIVVGRDNRPLRAERPVDSRAIVLKVGFATVDYCQISNSYKCSNCYGARAFWGPADLCVKLVLYYMQGGILEFRCRRQTLRKATLYFRQAIQKLYSLKAS